MLTKFPISVSRKGLGSNDSLTAKAPDVGFKCCPVLERSVLWRNGRFKSEHRKYKMSKDIEDLGHTLNLFDVYRILHLTNVEYKLYLRDRAGSAPDHHKKANTAIK